MFEDWSCPPVMGAAESPRLVVSNIQQWQQTACQAQVRASSCSRRPDNHHLPARTGNETSGHTKLLSITPYRRAQHGATRQKRTCKAGQPGQEFRQAWALHHKHPTGVQLAAPAHQVGGDPLGEAGGPAGGEAADQSAI